MPLDPLGPGDPREVGPHRLLGRLGRGGMGTVYLALTPEDRAVAVKVLRDGPADVAGRQRFRRELEVLQRVRGPHLVEVLGGDAEAATPWLVTRFVPGRRLDELVAEDGPLDEPGLVRVALGTARGLRALHSAGVVHRDLTPGNVLLVDGEPHIIDLGLAVVADVTALTRSGLVVGTAGYLAPEQVLGTGCTAAADVHAWGATLALAGTGRPPYGTGRPEAVLYRVVHAPPDLEGLPDALAALVAGALAKDPAARPSVDELVAALEPLAARSRDLVGVSSGPHPVLPGVRHPASLGRSLSRGLGRAVAGLRAAGGGADASVSRDAPGSGDEATDPRGLDRAALLAAGADATTVLSGGSPPAGSGGEATTVLGAVPRAGSAADATTVLSGGAPAELGGDATTLLPGAAPPAGSGAGVTTVRPGGPPAASATTRLAGRAPAAEADGDETTVLRRDGLGEGNPRLWRHGSSAPAVGDQAPESRLGSSGAPDPRAPAGPGHRSAPVTTVLRTGAGVPTARDTTGLPSGRGPVEPARQAERYGEPASDRAAPATTSAGPSGRGAPATTTLAGPSGRGAPATTTLAGPSGRGAPATTTLAGPGGPGASSGRGAGAPAYPERASWDPPRPSDRRGPSPAHSPAASAAGREHEAASGRGQAGVLAAAGLGLIGAAGLLLPVLTAVVVVCLLLALQAHSRGAARRRELVHRRGPRRRDGAVSLLRLPVSLTGAALDLLGGLPLLLVGAVLPGYAVTLVSPADGPAVVVATTAVLGTVLTLARRRCADSRRTLGRAATSLSSEHAVVAAALLLGVAVVVLLASRSGPTWWPAPAGASVCVAHLSC